MNQKLEILLTRKQEIAVEINKLAHQQRKLTEEIRELEGVIRKENLLGREAPNAPGNEQN